MYARRFLSLLTVLLASSCALFGAPAGGEAPMRSPTLDYPPPATETSDGQVVGADGMRPEDKLHTSPRIGSGGVAPAQVPASIEKKRRPEPEIVPEDPTCKVLGMNDAIRNERCHGSPRP